MDLSYMKTAEVGIPEDLERLKWTGRIKEYEKTAQQPWTILLAKHWEICV